MPWLYLTIYIHAGLHINIVRYFVTLVLIQYTLIKTTTLKRKCFHLNDIFITGCSDSCHFDNFRYSRDEGNIKLTMFLLKCNAAICGCYGWFHTKKVFTFYFNRYSWSHNQSTPLKRESSFFWRNFQHWLYRKWSKWQQLMHPVMKISSQWQFHKFQWQSPLRYHMKNLQGKNKTQHINLVYSLTTTDKAILSHILRLTFRLMV